MGLALIMIALAVFVGGGAVLYTVGLYNTLVQVRHNVGKAWKNIDVLLQQRHDEIPKLVEVCKGFMTHERSVLTELTRLRSEYDAGGSVEAKTRTENQINRCLASLRATAEAYPALQSVTLFQQLGGRISALESNIAGRREFFNDSVNVYNIAIDQFPAFLLARLLAYKPHPFLEVPEEKKQDAAVSFQTV
jgi:LemA protein